MSDTSSKDTEPVPASRPQNIPVGWETRRLIELATNHDGKRVPLKQSDRERRRGDYPYYGASGIIDSIDGFLFDGDYVLLGEDGENVVSRHLPLAFRVTGKFWVNNHAHVYEPFQNVDIRFLVGLLDATDFSGLVSGSAQPKLTQEALQRLRFVVPPYGEQRAIAAVLDTIDDAIQKTEQIIAKLQQVKQGLLHDLLTRGIDDNGELRDPERHPEQFQDSPLGRIPKGWEVEKLRVLYSEPSRNGLYKGPAYHGRGAPMIQMGNLFASDEVSFSDTGRVSVSESELRTFGLRVGDILFARRSLVFEGAGRAAVVGVVPEPATFESSIVRVRLRTERILPRFAVTYLASHQGYLRRRAHIRQVAVSGVSGTDIASFFMAIPTLSEQQTIVETKAILDLQIENEARARGALMSMKNGLADDLLTGRVRTTSLPEFSA